MVGVGLIPAYFAWIAASPMQASPGPPALFLLDVSELKYERQGRPEILNLIVPMVVEFDFEK